MKSHLLVCSLISAWVVLVVSTSSRAESAPAHDASRAELLYKIGTQAFDAKRFVEARQAFCDAFELVGDPVLLHNCARSAEESGELEAARELYHQLLQHPDLPEALRARGGQDVERVVRAIAESQPAPVVASEPVAEGEAGGEASVGQEVSMQEEATADHTLTALGWSSLALGVALSAVGAGLVVDAELTRDAVRDAQSQADNGGVVSDVTRADALSAEKRANMEDTAGWIMIPVGLASTIVGATVLWAMEHDNAQFTVGPVTHGEGIMIHGGARF